MGASEDLSAALASFGLPADHIPNALAAIASSVDVVPKGGGDPVQLVGTLTATRKAIAGVAGEFILEVDLGEGRGSFARWEKIAKDASSVTVIAAVYLPDLPAVPE